MYLPATALMAFQDRSKVGRFEQHIGEFARNFRR